MEGSESAAAAKEEEEADHQNPLVKEGGGGFKGKSCKGCLYYSSILKSKSRKPFCVGVSRTLQQVPGYIVGESDIEASKDARNLTEFKYACVGYSVYLDKKDASADPKEKRAELPFCVGIELVVDKRASVAQHAPAPVRAHKKEDNHGVIPQPRQYKPEELLGRFTRNAGLVASGVSKNMHRVGNYVKDSLDDILYPYRRRPNGRKELMKKAANTSESLDKETEWMVVNWSHVTQVNEIWSITRLNFWFLKFCSSKKFSFNPLSLRACLVRMIFNFPPT